MLVEAEIWTVAHTEQGNAVLVRPLGVEAAVPIFIGQTEAQSILIGMGDIPMPRPNTHDLFLTVLHENGSRMTKAEILSIRDGVFYAKITVESGGESRSFDSRSSDALALAIREKCPIFIEEDIVDEAGIALSTLEPEQEEPPKESRHHKFQLQKSLQEAIEKEDYERAARIRDELKGLDGSL